MPEVANFWESVVQINTWHQNRISKIVIEKLFGTISQKKIIILGFAFKANTNDTRESAAISICKDLIDEGAYLLIYDPKVNPEQIESDLQIKQKKFIDNKNSLNEQLGGWEFCQNLEIFDDAHAALILTEWEEFKNINWEKLSKKMAKPAWIIDSRSIVNPTKVKEAGLKLWRLGDGSQNSRETF